MTKNKAEPAEQIDEAEAAPRPPRWPRKIALSEYSAVSYHAFVDDDVTLEEIAAPKFWLHARGLKTHDEIRVIQNSRWTHCLVTHVIPGGGAEVAILLTRDVTAPRSITGAELPEGYEIRVGQAGDIAGYSIIRLRDGRQINTHEASHTSFDAARTWLLENAIFKLPTRAADRVG
jgi:hypothetical protein